MLGARMQLLYSTLLLLVVFALGACSNSGRAFGVPYAAPARAPALTGRAKGPIAIEPSSLSFSRLGKAGAKALTVAEKKYHGKFGARGCSIAKTNPKSGSGPSWKLEVVPLKFGTCKMLFSDSKKHDASLSIVIASPSPSPSPSLLPSPSPSPSPTASPSPTGSPAAVYVTYSTSSSSGTIVAFDEQGNLKKIPGSWAGAGEPFQIAYDAHNAFLYADAANVAPELNAYDAQGNHQTLSPGFAAAGNVLAFAIDSHTNDLYVSHQTPIGCVTTCTNLLSVYDEMGNLVSISGGFSGFGFATPGGIAFDSHNDVLYVVDNTVSVVAYDEQGNTHPLSGSFSQPTSCTGTGYPANVAFNPLDNLVYVGWTDCNSGKGTVAAYDENGNLDTLTGSFPNVNTPVGIAVDTHTGDLYVADSGSNTITVYDMQGNQLATSGAFNPGFGFTSSTFLNGVAVIPPATAAVRHRRVRRLRSRPHR